VDAAGRAAVFDTVACAPEPAAAGGQARLSRQSALCRVSQAGLQPR